MGKKAASAAFFIGLAATQASAQSFLGGSLGRGNIDDAIAAGLITSGSVDGKGSAFKLFSGYLFTPHFGIEGAYVDLGRATYSGQFFGAPVTGGKVEVSGFNMAVLASYPATPEVSVFGKLGLFVWEWRASDTTAGAPFSTADRGTDLSFGAGVGYSLSRNLGVRAEWERFKLDDVDADLLSIGLVWRF